MTEVQMKKLALEIVKDGNLHYTAREKRLANAILTYFDPDFFYRPFAVSEKRVVLHEVRIPRSQEETS